MFRHVSEDLYELVIVRDSELKRYQGVFGTIHELSEWRMMDLYSKHPTKEGLWLHRGRMNPIDMEQTISMHPLVRTALVGGFQSSLLAEPVNKAADDAETGMLLETIWPTVQAANKEAPAYARIHKNMITFTSADMPMPRAGKGTVQRKMAMDLYAPELDALYKSNEGACRGNGGGDNALNESHGAVDGTTRPQDTVRHIIATCSDIDTRDASPNADLFELGLDSLQVSLMTWRLNDFLSKMRVPGKLEMRDVYANSSISALSSVVAALAEGQVPPQSPESRVRGLSKLYEDYGPGMPISGRPAQPKPRDEFAVLLTGSTGSLGSYVPNSLQGDPRVSRIYCLNRGVESSQGQQKSLAARGLGALTGKVYFLDADPSKPYFGHGAPRYSELLLSVTNIIPNAWKVDFNLATESFTGQIAMVRRLVDFSSASRYGAQIFFISSIGGAV